MEKARNNIREILSKRKVEDTLGTLTGENPLMKLLAGNSNRNLAELISKNLDVKLTKCVLERFSDGEVSFNIKETVRGEDCYVIQSTCSPVNENIMELLIMWEMY